MLVIPAIDIFEGKCVRLRQGDYAQQTVYSDDPRDVAQKFVDAGLGELHVVDLEGARDRKITNWKALESILSLPGVSAEVGGGVRTSQDIQKLLQLGAKRVVLGSVAAKSPALIGYWAEQFGRDVMTVGVDVRNNSVAVSGWLEDSKLSPVAFILEMTKHGVKRFVCTDINSDGILHGPNLSFYRQLKGAFREVEIVASGGVSSLEDIRSLGKSGASAVIVGKALYEGRITLASLNAEKVSTW